MQRQQQQQFTQQQQVTQQQITQQQRVSRVEQQVTRQVTSQQRVQEVVVQQTPSQITFGGRPGDASPPVFEQIFRNARFAQGGNALFEGKVRGNPKPAVSWTRKGAPLTESNKYKMRYEENTGNVSLLINHIGPGDEGEYTCTARNQYGEAICSVFIQPEGAGQQVQQQGGYQKEFAQTFETSEQRVSGSQTQSSFQRFQQTSGKISYANGHAVEEDFKVDTFEYRLLREVEFRESLTRRYVGEIDAQIVTTVDRSLGPVAPPQIAQKPRNSKLAEGSDATFQAKITANPKPRLTWFKNGQRIVQSQKYQTSFSNQQASLRVVNARSEDSGHYTLLAENPQGCVVSSAYLAIEPAGVQDGFYDSQRTSTLKSTQVESTTVDSADGKTLAPNFVRVCTDREASEGKMTRFDCRVTGRPYPEVYWFINGRQLSDDATHKILVNESGNHALMITNVNRSDAGVISCIARNKSGETSFQCNLTVIEKEQVVAPKFVERFTTVHVKEGEPVVLNARAVGTPIPRITWQKDGVPIVPGPDVHIAIDSGASTLDIPRAKASDAAWYQCTAQNVAGSTATRARLFVELPKGSTPEPRRLNLPRPTKVIEPEIAPGPEVIYLRHVERAKPHAPQSEEDRIYPPPQFIVPLRDVSQVEGGRVHFEARIEPVGDPTMRVDWFVNGRPLEASSRATTTFRFGFIALDLISIIIEDSGEYVCRVTSQSGCVESQALLSVTGRAPIEQLSQHPDSLQYIQQLEDYSRYQRTESVEETSAQRPTFIRPLQDLGELQEGRNAHFEAQLTPVSDPTMKVEWYKDGKPITASSRITTIFNFGYVSLNIMHLRVEDAGTYTVRAVNHLGEAISTSTLRVFARTSVTGDLGIPEQQRYIEKVEELEAYQQQQQYKYVQEVPESTTPPEFKTPIKDQTNIREGGFAHFEARLEPIGDSTLQVEWLKDGRPVEASSRITTFFNFGYVALTIKHVTTHDIGVYTCRAFNRMGQATTSAQLTVISKKDIILDSQHPGGLEKIQYLEDASRYGRSVQEETTVTQKPRFMGPLKGTNKIVEGQRAHFEVRVEPQNDMTLQIEWYFNGRVIQSANRIQTYHDFGYVAIDILSVRSEDAGTYTVVARNALGEAQLSATMEVEVRSSVDTRSMHHMTMEKTQHLEGSKFVEPQYHIEEISKSKPIFVQPLSDPKPVNEGKNIHLECRLEPMGDPTMRVEWFYNGRPVTVGSRFRTYYDFGFVALDIIHVTSLDAGEYTVRATNHLGSAHTSACVRVISRSDIVTESQNEAALEQIQMLEDSSRYRRHVTDDVTIVQAPQFTRPLHNLETVEGTNVHLECRLQPVGDPSMRVDWFVNGRPVPTGHRFRPAYDFDYVALDLLSVYPVDSGVYTCQARNQLGEAVTSCSVKVIAKKDLILESQHPSGLEKIQYLEDSSRYKKSEYIDEVVNIKPKFITKPKSLDNMREGQHAHFECKLEPVTDSYLKVEWYKNGRPITVGHRFRPIHDFGYVALDIIDLIAEDSGTYTCRAVNLVGADETTCTLICRSTAQIVTLTQNETGLEQIQYLEDRSRYQRTEYVEETTKQAPIFTTSLKQIDIKEGQRAHFECRLIPVSDPTMKVEWFHNNVPVKSGSRFTETNNFGFVALDILYCYPEDSGTYTCRAKNILGEAVTSANLSVHSKKSIYLETQHESALDRITYLEDSSRYQRQTVQEETISQAPVFTQPMRDIRVAENQAVHFEARLIPVGDPKLKVEWLRNGVPIQASNRVTTMHDFGYVALNMKYVYPEDSGTYTCRATNELGQAVTSSTLVVHSKASLLLETQHEGAMEKLHLLEDSSRYRRREEEEIIVTQAPRFTAQLNGPTNLMEAQSAHYECRIEPYPDPNLKVEWYHNGNPLQTGHRFRTTYDFGFAALDILTVYAEDSGEYTCKAINNLGQATSSIKLNVKSRSSIILETQHEGALQKIQYLEDDSRYKRTKTEETVIAEKPQFGRPLRNVEHLPEGLSVHLEATLTPVNDPTMRVEWYCDGRPIPQGHRFKTTYDFGFVALDILYAYAEDSGTYMCKAKNAVGEAVTTCSVKVEAKGGLYLDTLDEQRLKKIREMEAYERPSKADVEPQQQKPVFITPLNSLENLKEGDHAHLECRVEPINDPNLKIEWYVNGVAIKTGHRFRTTHDFGYVALDVLYTYAEDSGTYMAKATNLLGEAVNTCQITIGARRSIYLESQHPEGLAKIKELEAQGRPARLEVEEPVPTPPRFITELRGTTDLFEGQTAHFEAQVEPLHDPNLRIEFYHNGKPLPSASRFHITFDFGYVALDISHVVPEDAGEYTVRAINNLGQCTSSINLRVQAKGNIILESQRPEGLEKIRQLEGATPFQRPEVPEPQTRQRPVFTQPLQNIDAIAEGQTAHFECRLIPVGDPTLKVEWFRNERPLETSSRITRTHDFGFVALDMTHVRGEDDGVYMCRASNALGEAVTTASMKIRTKASIQLETQHPEGMRKIKQLEEGRAPARPDEPDRAFEKPVFTQLLTGPSELWEGQHAHFECRVVPVGDPSLRFEWFVNGIELKMGSRFHVTHDFGFVTLDIHSVITEDAGVYMCKAVNNAGEAVSSTSLKVKSRSSIVGEPLQPDAWQKIQLKEAEMNKVPQMFVDTTPQQAPVFTTHLVSHDKLVEGQHVMLEAQVEPRADPNLRVEWFKNGITLTTGTRIRSTFDFGLVTLAINGLRPDDSAIYTCKATNLLGEAVSTCTLKIEDRHWLLGSSLRPEALPIIEGLEAPKGGTMEVPEPVYESPVFITHLNNVECREGDAVHFECHVEPSKDPTLNIEWYVNGKPLPSAARFKSTYDFGYVSLDINHAYAEDSGIYMCKATNEKGQAQTSGTLKCTSKQDIYLDTQHPQGQAGLEKVQEAEDAYLSKYQRQLSGPETAYPKPVFTTPLEPQFSLKESEPLHLECTVEPKEDPNLKVEWYFNGKALEHGARFKMTCDFGFVTLHLTDVYERDQGIYTCKAYNLAGEAFTSTTIYCVGKTGLIEHTQHPKGAEGLEKIQDLEESLRRQEGALPEGEEGHPPVFTSQFQNLSNLSEGDIAHFEASLTPVGDQTMVVEWFYKGEVLKASHRTRTVHAFGMVVLEILGTKIEDSGTYTCRATNKWGRAEISVELECVDKSKGQKPQFTSHIQSLDGLKDGDSAHFECTLIPVGDPHLKVEWFHNGQPIRHSSRIKSVSDFGFVVMDISYVQSHDSGEYVCRASNKYGEDFTRATIKCAGKGGVYLDTLQPDSLARIRELEVGQGAPQTPTTPVMEPPKFITQIADVTQLVEGQSAHFEARLTPVNDPNLTVEWFYNGKKLPHGHRYRTFHDFGIVILDILYCYEENSGEYECRAVNKVGQDSTKATLKCVSKANLILDSQLPRGMEGGLEKIQTLEDSLIRTRDERSTESRGQAPVFTVPLSNIDSLREGENAHFEARLTPTDDPKLKVEWFWNGKPLRTGSRFRTFCDFGFVILEISPVYPEDSGEYSCRAFNDYGQAVTTATMKVQGKRSIILESQLPKGMERTIEKIAELEGLGTLPGQTSPEIDSGKPPEFITTPADLTLTENSLAHFECQLTPINDSSMRVEWFHNGKPLSAGSRIKTINDFGFVILEVAGVYQRDSGLYTCKATNRHGEATVSCKLQVRGRQGIVMEPQLPTNFRTGTESIQKLEEALYKRDEILSEEEKPDPPRFTLELKDINDVPEGGAIHFECRVEPIGDSTMRIDWFHNGRPFATGSRVRMLNDFGFIALDMDYTYARDSGEYICRATNKWGSATTKATLTCKAKRDVVLDSQLPQGMSGEKLKELERGPVSHALPEDAPLSPPKFITQIESVGIGEGEPVHFECRVEPKTDPKLRVEWYRNGKLLPTGHRFRTLYDMGFVSLDILYTYPEDSGEYVCRAVNDLGEDKTRASISCKKLPTIILQNQVPKGMKKSEALMQMEATIKKYTSEIFLTEDDLYDIEKKQPPRFVTQILDQTSLVEMQSTKFECQLAPVGDPNMKVEWFFNGKPLPHKNRFTPIYDFGYVAMNFGWVYPEDSGEYLCRATNLYGMDETRAIIKTAGKPGIIYESQLPKGMKSIERIREMEAAWQIVPEEATEDLKPKQAPAFVTKPEPFTVTEGEMARFCCRVTGHPKPRVMWVVNGHTVVNGTRYKLTYDGMWHLDIPKTRQYDHGKVEVIARNSAGEAVAVTDLTVKPREDDYRNVLKNSPRRIIGTKEYRKPEWVTQMEELQEQLRATQCVPTFIKEILDARAVELETVVFECQYSGTPTPDIVWYHNDKAIRNTKNVQIRIKDNKTTCTIQKVTTEDEGTYVCKAASEIGMVMTKAKLEVKELAEDEKRELVIKMAREEQEKIKMEKALLEKKREERRKKKYAYEIEREASTLESTTQFTETTAQAKAETVLSVQDSVSVSAIASCKKIDDAQETTEPLTDQAKKIMPIQEPVQVVETKPVDAVEDFRTKLTKLRSVAARRLSEVQQQPITVSEVQPQVQVKEFVQKKKVEGKAQKIVTTQETVTVTQVTSQATAKEFTEKRTEEKAVKKMPVQKSVTVSEVQSEGTVKEFKQDTKISKAQRVMPVQESVTISEVQSEATVKELQEKKPKTRRAKPEKKPAVKETAVVTQVKTLTAEEILETEETKIATEVEDLMKFVKAREFGPGESPLRELAKIGFLVRQGISVNEITTLYQADRFPALRTPEAQSAMVQLVEREGHSALISQVLTEESATDEDRVAATVGFRAFMRMVELRHAAVDEVITHFTPEDFRPHAWETSEATQVVTRDTTTERVKVMEQAEVHVEERKKVVKKTRTTEEAETEGEIPESTTPTKEQVRPTIPQEKESVIVETAEAIVQEESFVEEEVPKLQIKKEDIPELETPKKEEVEVKEVPKIPKKKKVVPEKPKTATEERTEEIAEDFVPEKLPVSEKAEESFIVHEGRETIQITEGVTTTELKKADKPRVGKAEQTVILHEGTETAEVTTEIVTEELGKIEKPAPVTAEQTLLPHEVRETIQVTAETHTEELKKPEITVPVEAVPIEETAEEVTVSETDVKVPVRRPSKKKKKEVEKPKPSELITQEESVEDIVPVIKPKPEKAKDAVTAAEAVEITEVTPEVTTVEIKPEERAPKEAKLLEEQEEPVSVTEVDVKAPIKKPSKKKKKVVKEERPTEAEVVEEPQPVFSEEEEEEKPIKKSEVEKPIEKKPVEEKPKEKKPVLEKMKPQLMKIERKEIKPTKIKVVDVKEEVPLFAQVKLRKASIQKREIQATELPKVLLKSNLKVVEYPPEEIKPIVTVLNVKSDRGILSRNTQEALKLQKRKIRKVKLSEKEEVELEEPAFEIEEPEKAVSEEEEEEKPSWERLPKKPEPEEIEERKLVMGKGKIPKVEEEAEQVTLKKIPQKPQEAEEIVTIKPKKIEPQEIKTRELSQEVPLELKPLKKPKPYRDEPEEIQPPQVEQEVPEEEVPQPEKVVIPKPKETKPEPEVIQIPLKKGVPKKPVPEPEDDISLRKKMGEPEKEIPEEIKLKPFTKEKPQEEPEEKVVKIVKPKPKKKPEEEEEIKPVFFKHEDVPEITEEIKLKKPAPKLPTEEETVEEIKLIKPKKPVEEEIVEEITLKKVKPEPKEEVSEEIVITKLKPKEPVTEEVAEEITIRKIEPEKPKEEIREEVTLKKVKKPKKPEVVEDVAEEITIKKKEPEKPQEIEEVSEEVTLKKVKKPKKPEVVEEVAEEITIKKEPEKPQEVEEVKEEITLKKVKKPKKPEVVEEVSEEITIKKKEPVPQEVEEVKEEITLKKVKKPKKPEVVEEVSEEITIKKEPEKPQVEEVSEEITLKKVKKPKKPEVVEEVAEEITIKKKEPEKPKEVEEISEEITLKKVKKPKKPEVVEEVAEEITIKKEPEKPQEVEEVSEEITLKKVKKPKKPEVVEEVAEEITIKKKEPEKPKEVEEISEEITLKKVKKPKKPEVVEEVAEEITIKKEPEKPKEVEEVSEEITLKKVKKPKKPEVVEEVAEEITIKKKEPEKETPAEDIAEEFTIKPRRKGSRKESVEEITEEITLRKLKPVKKRVPQVEEVTEVETVTIVPSVTKTKEEIEQEFKIQLHTYEEEDITMSGKVRLKKQRPKTFAEETGEETIRITQEIEGPEEVEIIEEPEEEEVEVVEFTGSRKRPSYSYKVEEPEEEEETIRLGPRRISEDIQENFQVQLKRKTSQEVQQTSYSVQEIEEAVQIGLRKKHVQEGTLYEEESMQVKLKPKRKPSKTIEQEAVSLSITKETEVFEEDLREAVVTELQEGDLFFSVTSYVAENEDAINLVEGERVYVLEQHNSDWWFVKKHLTEEKGLVPAQLLQDEPSYTAYVQKKVHQKIDKLPVFEKPTPGEQATAPCFVQKLQPKHAQDGTTVQFECQVEGTPRPQITWFKETAILLPSQDFQIYYDDDNVATLIVREVFPEDAGKFTCVAKNAAGFASSTTELMVEAPLSDHGSDTTISISRKSLSRESSLADILEGIPPMFARKPKAVCVDEGTDVELESRLVAVPEPEVTWFCNGKEIKSTGNVTIISESDIHMYTSIVRIKKIKKTQDGNYEVIAKNREGEASVKLTVKVKTGDKEPPQILEPLKSMIVEEGESVILSTQVVGNPTPKVTWLKDGKPVSDKPTRKDGDTYILTLQETTPEDTAKYTVTAKNNVGVAETTASLVVEELPFDKPEPPMFIERFEEEKVPEKGTLRLLARVTGNPTPKIIWLRNNEPLKPTDKIAQTFDGETAVLEIRNADSEEDAGDYKCLASNPVGKASHGAKVTVDVDKVTFTKNLKQIVQVEEQTTLSLECETSHSVSTKWFHNGKEISGMDHREVIHEGRLHKLVINKATSRDAGTYKCTVKNQTTESKVTVKELKPDFIRKLQDFEVKERESAILEVEISSETADVTWHKDGEQIQLTPDKFVFEKQGTIRKLLIRGTSVHDEGEYTCALGEQECTAEVTVVELPPEIITKMQDMTIAKGEKATFEIELTKGDALVRWFKDDKELQFSEHVQLSIDGKRQKLKIYNSELEDSGVYSCRVGEQTSSATLKVEEPVVDFITRLPDVTLIPLNTDATFTVELSRPDVEVKWLKKGKVLKESERHIITSEGTVRKLVIKKVTLEDQTDYSCVAVNVKTTSKLKVEIIETAPRINVDVLKKEYKVKKGEDVTIEVKYTSTPTPNDEWFVNGKLVKKSKRITQTLTEASASLTIKKVEEEDVGSYTIRLSNNCGEASAELTLILMEPPSQPGIPEVIEVTDTTVTLHWKAPDSDGNSPIINYILEYHDKSDFTWIKVNENFTIVETTHKVVNLEHNMEYMFKVTALNEVGPSPPSHNTRYIKISAPVAAEPPTIQEPLKSVVCGLKQTITLSCVIGGVPEPEIKWTKDGRSFKNKSMTYENRIAKYVITETTEKSAGTYSCQARNDAGEAETSCQLKIQESPKLEVDENLMAQKLRVTNQWKIEVKFSGYPTPEVSWNKNGETLTSTKHCSVYTEESSTTIAIYSLTKEDTGTYTVTARNEAGFSSIDLNLRVIDKPSKPEGPIVVKDIRKESVIIEWKPPADDGGLELSKYSVEKCDVEKMVWMKVADVEKDVSSYCVQRLREDSEYMFRVIAENPVGTSEALESETVTVRSKFDKPSPPRGPFDVSGMSDTSFTLAWQAPEADGGSPIIEYIVERREVNKKAWQKVGVTSAEETNIEVTGLKANTSYHFRVTARNDIGSSIPYAPEEPITAGKRISSPSAPTNLSVADITSKSVTLQWGPPLTTGGTELTGYIVEMRLESAKTWTKVVTLEPTITQHCIENLKEKSELFFRVYAENSMGLSPAAATEIVSLKTHATPPSPPTAPLEIRSVGPNSIIIEWGIPESDGGAPLESYTIAIRDIRKTMWMEVGRVKADIQKLNIKDLQENHEYLIRIFARNEVGLSEPLESEEPFKVLRPTEMEYMEIDKAETTAPTLSFSTETTTSWMKEAGMDADIRSYARGSLLRRDEYFFRIWYYARQLFK